MAANPYIKLEWRNNCDMANILYQTGYTQWMYIDGEVTEPEYVYTIESFSNGEEEETRTFQKVEKTYKLKFIAPEFLCDALSLVPIHDLVWVTLKNGERGQAKDVAFETNWETDCFANCTITFTVTYYIRANCCENEDLTCATDNAVTVKDIILDSSATYTAPTENGVQDGDKYLVLEDGGSGEGWVATWSVSTNAWVQTLPSIVYDSDSTIYYIYDGDYWLSCPAIVNLTDAASKITVQGRAFPASFVGIYIRGGIYTNYTLLTTITDGAFGADGYETDVLAPATYDFLIINYTHSCSLGNDVRTITIK